MVPWEKSRSWKISSQYGKIKKKKEETQTPNIQNERQGNIAHLTDISKDYKGILETTYSNKFDNIDQCTNFLGYKNYQKLNLYLRTSPQRKLQTSKTSLVNFT